MRLIDADKLEPSEMYTGDGFTRIVYMDDIDEMPTVDIDAITESHEKIGYDKGFRDGYAQAMSEVRHGQWKPSDKGDCTYTCSNCGFFRDAYLLDENKYCPHCGAKMDEV